jgi:hypothetical protein
LHGHVDRVEGSLDLGVAGRGDRSQIRHGIGRRAGDRVAVVSEGFEVASIVAPRTAFCAVGGAAVDTLGIPLVAMTVLRVLWGACMHAATPCVSTTMTAIAKARRR